MTRAAITSLRQNDRGFFLMVEAASIDKQSHSGHAAGATWDDVAPYYEALATAR